MKNVNSNESILETVINIKQIIDTRPFDNDIIKKIIQSGGSYRRKLIQKTFKDKYGTRIQEYQIKIKMEIVAKLLDQENLSKKEIANRLGYKKPNNFSAAFKKKHKVTPNDWVKSKLDRITKNVQNTNLTWHSNNTFFKNLY